jgi:phosphatidylglycerophosphate synthase
LVGVGAAAWIVPAALGAQPARRRLRAGLGWWAATAAMLEWHLGMVEGEDGAPQALGAADACTLARAWLVPLAAERPGPAVCLLGFGSDGLDGALARRSRTTRAGRDLEGLVDAAFAVAAVRGAVRCGGLGTLPAAAESTRVLCGAALTTAAYLKTGRPPDAALAHSGRATAPLRMAGIAAAGTGRRRLADLLVTGGALAAVAALLRQLLAGRSVTNTARGADLP